MNAYVLIQSSTPGVPMAGALRGVRGVVHADDVTGAYDVIAVARPDAVRTLEAILQEIRSLAGVTRAIPARQLAPVAAANPVAFVEPRQPVQAA